MEAVYSALSGDATISAMVGAEIHRHFPPEEATTPNISFFQVSGGADNADGVPAISRARIQVDIRATPEDDPDGIGDAVVSAMGGIHGAVSLANERDGFDQVNLVPVQMKDFIIVAKL
jgi:hypothetical protein